MKLTRLISVGVILGSVAVGALQAQSTGPGSQPAEFPPATYKGKQYVDSNGCVFIRAGIDGNVTWVPRVGRDRKGVCGFKPSLAGQVTEVTITPIPEAATEITTAETVAPPPAPKPAPVPRVVRQTAPKRAPAPVIIAEAPAPVLPPQVSIFSGRPPACTNASRLSQRYINDGSKYPVRCGPQGVAVTAGRDGGATRQAGYSKPAPIQVSPDTRIVPRHVAVRRINTRNVVVPEGYKAVWEDDRLNPYRAEQTLQGRSDMLLIWTNTVPRRLINQSNGRDVTAETPLVYPYLDEETQRRELGVVTVVRRDGQTMKRILHNPGSGRAPVYSSRSTPKDALPATPVRASVKPKASFGRGYVDVATLVEPEEAQRMARQVQRLGLPVRIGRYSRGERTYRVIIAGPFKGDAETRKALQRLVGAGFAGAKPRQ